MTVEAPNLVEHVFLVGRPPLSEYIGFITTQTVDGRDADKQEVADTWRAANDHIQSLEDEEAGFADGLEADELPSELDEDVERLRAEPAFRNSFSIVPTTVGMVEIDRLVVFQKHINLDYVRELSASLPDDPTPRELFTFCMSPGEARPPVMGGQQPSGNVFVFQSPSTDLRLLGMDLVSPETVPGLDVNGHPTSVLTIPIGYGSNYLNAVSVEGRLVLNNGSHRAYALRERGHAIAPMVIQHVTRWEEVEVVGPRAVYQNRTPYLDDPRPPVLKDYFDELLRNIVMLPKRSRQVRVNVGFEQIDVPG